MVYASYYAGHVAIEKSRDPGPGSNDAVIMSSAEAFIL